jgi:hypothetical protein
MRLIQFIRIISLIFLFACSASRPRQPVFVASPTNPCTFPILFVFAQTEEDGKIYDFPDEAKNTVIDSIDYWNRLFERDVFVHSNKVDPRRTTLLIAHRAAKSISCSNLPNAIGCMHSHPGNKRCTELFIIEFDASYFEDYEGKTNLIKHELGHVLQLPHSITPKWNLMKHSVDAKTRNHLTLEQIERVRALYKNIDYISEFP